MPKLPAPPIPDAQHPRLTWTGLHAGAEALALAEAVRAGGQCWVYLTQDARELERMAAELRFYGGPGIEILSLPDWEVLPYDVFSPHPDIVSERL
jgi:transcription-repair coupling factor (superfamily II helicase)